MSNVIGVKQSLLRHLPPSAQKVYNILHHRDAMRVSDIESETRYSYQMICFALRRLMDQRLISQISNTWYYSFAINR